jgi:hypothetical protein
MGEGMGTGFSPGFQSTPFHISLMGWPSSFLLKECPLQLPPNHSGYFHAVCLFFLKLPIPLALSILIFISGRSLRRRQKDKISFGEYGSIYDYTFHSAKATSKIVCTAKPGKDHDKDLARAQETHWCYSLCLGFVSFSLCESFIFFPMGRKLWLMSVSWFCILWLHGEIWNLPFYLPLEERFIDLLWVSQRSK